MEDDELSFDSDFNSITSEDRRPAEETLLESAQQPRHEYDKQSLDRLVGYIKRMVILCELHDRDWNDECTEMVENWLEELSERLLIFYFVGNTLTASVTFPLKPVSDMCYFMRNLKHTFRVENFHDEVTFGTLGEDLEGTLLQMTNDVIVPLLLDQPWNESIKTTFFEAMHSFLGNLTQIHYKLSGLTILYVPREKVDPSAPRKNSLLVKRLENVVAQWTSQIRMCLNDTEQMMPEEILCLTDEYDFWNYKNEVLQALIAQFHSPQVINILAYIDGSQSLYVKHMNNFTSECIAAKEHTQQKILALSLLVEPCQLLETTEPASIPFVLIKIIQIIRYLSTKTIYANSQREICRLFAFLSNQLIVICATKLNVPQLLIDPVPRNSIQKCNVVIDCCLSYKLILREMEQDFNATNNGGGDHALGLNFPAIFNQIDAFLQRLYDLIEILEATIVFGRQDENNERPKIMFGCNSGHLFESLYTEIQNRFADNLETIQSVAHTILNIHDKSWYKCIAEFQTINKELESIAEYIIENSLICTNNVEEVLEVLTTLIHFTNKNSLMVIYEGKVKAISEDFAKDLANASASLLTENTSRPSFLPKYSGKTVIFLARLNKIKRLKSILELCEFIPNLQLSTEILNSFASLETSVKSSVNQLFEDFLTTVSGSMQSQINRTLLTKSIEFVGFVDCNIDRKVLQQHKEIEYFVYLKMTIPVQTLTLYKKNKNLNFIFNNVLSLILDFNKIRQCLSEKERLLFHVLLNGIDRRIVPGFTKLMWDTDISEAYIMDCNKKIEDIDTFIFVYKTINEYITKICEVIACQLMMTAHIYQPTDLYRLKSIFLSDREENLRKIAQLYKTIVNCILIVYEGFEHHIATMTDLWIDYIRKIDKLIENALVICTKRSMEKILLMIGGNSRIHPEPILQVLLDLTDTTLIYEPDNDTILYVLFKALTDSSVLKLVPRLPEKFGVSSDDDKKHSFYNCVLENDECNSIKTAIKNVLLESHKNLTLYAYTWMEFKRLWQTDKDEFIGNFLCSEPDADAFQQLIKEYELIIKEIQSQEAASTIGFIKVGSQKLKTSLYDHGKEWTEKISTACKNLSGKKLNELYDYTVKNIKDLTPEPVALQELQQAMHLHKTLTEEISSKEQEIGHVRSLFALLEKYEIEVPTKMEAKERELPAAWESYKKDLKLVEERLDETKEKFKLYFLESARGLKSSAQDFLHKLPEIIPVADDIAPAQALLQIQALKENLKELYESQKAIQNKLKTFEINQPDNLDLKNIEDELTLLEELWMCVRDWEEFQLKYATAIFRNINIEELEGTSLELFGKINYFAQFYQERSWIFLQVAREKVFNFKQTLPLITYLKNPALQTRHWDKVRTVTGQMFDEQSPDFNLAVIISMNLQKFGDFINEISNAATMEMQIEKAVLNITEVWRSLKIVMVHYKDTYLKIQSVDDCIQRLEDDLVAISAMKSTKFVEPFEDVVNYWEKKLSYVYETIELLMLVQRKWLYFEEIFLGEDICRDMKNEAVLFQQLCEEWLSITVNLKNQPIVVKGLFYVPQPKLLTQLTMIMEKLETIQKALELYLEQKRYVFPRFYFISNDDLLEILGNSKQPNNIQIHMKKLFDNLCKLQIAKSQAAQKHNKWEANGMFSDDGEFVPFSNTIYLEGPVEHWFCLIVSAMQKALHEHLTKTHQSLKKSLTKRDKWLEMWPGQLCLISSQLQWTADCTKCLKLVKVMNERAPLKKLKKKQQKLLSKLSEITRQELGEQMRLKINSMITIEIHSRDVIDKLYKKNVKDENQFEWSSQLRYYWDRTYNNCSINQTNTQFWYGYEYTGNSGRLVITPLTDRCYMTLTISLHLHRGGSPQGPAGTGKTETVKDLGKALGVWVIVNNCSEGLDYKSMAKFFSGLAQSGCWGCFDEFNRINIEVLSVVAQQIFSILNGLSNKLTKIVFDGDEIKLASTVAIFITMNPGYAGRTELPDNLKSMFRPISMIVPDDIIIAENLLYSDGFLNSKVLAKKVCTLYSLAKLQLSKQYHYDFGLRSMVSLLRYAGVKRRLLSHLNEDQIVYTAIKDMNYVKLTFDDLPLFDAIVLDILPEISIPEIKYNDLEASIRKQLQIMGLQPIPNIITKIIQLYEMKLSRHSVIILGDTCTAKSVTWKVLQAAYNDLKSLGNPKFTTCEVYPLNPKSMTLGELYGEYNFATGEWNDGVLSNVMRMICAKETPDQKWFLFDGPIDPIWIENMNSVMDDNKILTLVNGERITMPKQVSLLFETNDLSTASPATVSRAGMVYNDFKEFGWQPFVTSWLEKKNTLLSTQLQVLVNEWFQDLIDFKRKNCNKIVQTHDLNLIASFCKLWDCVAQRQFLRNQDDALVKIFFLFCVIWSIGATTDEKGRQKMDSFIKEKTGIFPLKGTVYDYFIDEVKGVFLGWETLLPVDWKLPKELPFYKLIVPTIDTVRYNYILEKLLINRHPVMLIGDVGTGKTLLAQNLLNSIKGEDYSTFSINMSAQTTAGFLQETIENCTEKRSKDLFVPKNNKHLICFIDDFNLPAKEEFGSQPPHELLRQWMDYQFWYDHEKLSRKFLNKITLICGMGPPGGSREKISSRTLSRFNVLNFTFPSQETLFRIFYVMLDNHLRTFDESVGILAKPITVATLNFYDGIVKKMLPTPSKIHYMFNMRDISKVFQGLLRGHEMFIKNKAQYLRLWVHECFRVFSDRLIDEKDNTWFIETLNERMEENFDVTLHSLCPNSESPIFCNLLNIHRIYTDTVDKDELINFIKNHLDEYNNVPGIVRMNLIMFKEAILHLMRIVRVISQPKGHMLVVGVGGSGRQSLCRLAAYLCEQITYQIEVTNKYQLAEFKEDLKVIYNVCSVKNKKMCFLLSDAQMVEDSFLEVVNNMLGNGQVFNLFKPEELDDIRNKLREKKVEQPITSSDEIVSYLADKFIENVHILFCVSPIGPNLSKYVRNFPGLINFTTIDWYKQWSQEALQEVALKFLENIQLNAPLPNSTDTKVNRDSLVMTTENRLHPQVADVCASIHLEVIANCEMMKQQYKRFNYVAPTNFLELLFNFKVNLEKKRTEIKTSLEKFERGLLKINETEKKVAILSEELQVNQQQVTAFQAECDEFIKEIQRQTSETDVAKATVGQQSKKIALEEDTCTELAEQAQLDLDKAMPALEAAVKALDALNKKDLTEIKSYGRPPVKVEKVLEAVLHLLLKEPSWAEAKRQLGDQNFLERLKNFDKDNVSDKMLKKIGVYTQDRELDPEKVGIVSTAAKSLMLWVQAIEKYGKIYKVVGPKKKVLDDALESLQEKQAQLFEAQATLTALTEKLEKLQQDYDAKIKMRQELTIKADTLRIMLERAVLLVDGLSSERLRWADVIKGLEAEFLTLPGDSLLSTAFVCYLGPFVSQIRDNLMKMWLKQVTSFEIPCNSNFIITDFLCDTFTKQEWNTMGLPSDTFSMENAVCITNCSRWPLLIDPQSQSHKWIKNLEEKNKLVTLDVGHSNFVTDLEKAIRFGRPVLLQNVMETFEATLTPIINKAFVHQGGHILLKFNNKYIEYNPSFKLYLTTKLANPHYLPEITTKTSLINFSIKEEGLEDQLLGIIVAKERPTLEEQKNSLTLNISNHRKTILKLENETLRLLNESKGPILENEKLISTLQSAKQTTVTVKDALATAEVNEREIDFTREGYRSGAKRASILYFIIQDLSNIDPMYQFSLAAYIDLFTNSIEKSTRSQILVERIENLNDYHTFSLYKFICRGLFEKHKLLFSFYMCVKILIEAQQLNMTEYNFMLKGGVVLDREGQMENPSSDWLSEIAWDNITELDKLPGFHGITDSFAENSEAWKAWFSSNEPEATPLVGDCRNYIQFQQMLIVRSLRADRMTFCLTSFVENKLGRKFVEPPTLNLQSVFDESLAKTPLIFLLSPGMDPVNSLLKLAETSKMSEKLDVLSLGQGQAEVATKLILEGAKRGRWVFLANCHLSISWMLKLDQIIDNVQGSKIHKRFRLWLSSNPHPDFPVSILQKSIKMTTEPPKGIKANMKRMYTVLTEDNFTACKDKLNYPKLVFCLCFLHSVLIERKKFKQLGWNSVYSFNDSDFEMSENIISIYLNDFKDMPWDALRYMISAINYGGHVTDGWDQRLLTSYSEQCFSEDTITVENYKLSALPSYYIPRDGTLQSYQDFVKFLPNIDAPELFGQHQNAEINSLLVESKTTFDTLLSLQSQATLQTTENKEVKVTTLAADLLDKIPTPVDYEKTKRIVGNNTTPLNIILLQEIQRYNTLLVHISGNLLSLQKAIAGLILMTADLEIVFQAIYDGQVPSSWQNVYPSLKPLGAWFRDLRARIQFFAKWAGTLRAPMYFWLGGFSFPTGFLTAVLQTSARSLKVPIDTLTWSFNVFEEMTPIANAPDEGVYMQGLYLEGASWDLKEKSLCEPKLMELVCQMPVVHFFPIVQAKRRTKNIYECPAYYYAVRAGSQKFASYVLTVNLQSGEPSADYWVKRGTALLLNLSD